MPFWATKVRKGQEKLQLERLDSSENPDCWNGLFMDTHTETAYNIWFSED